jgi:hypothetical protein
MTQYVVPRGKIYRGINLDWKYEEPYLDIIFIPFYIQKMMTRFNDTKPKKPQYPVQNSR